MLEKEIGGYMNIENNYGKEYHNCYSFNSARNCLQYIIRKRKIKKIYLPYYLCLVIEDVCKIENVEIIYYHIDEKFMPIIKNYDLSESKFVYIVNFFGQLSKKQINKLRKKFVNVIIDNTHEFYEKNNNTIDTIYNCRKYFGVPDGAYLSSNVQLDEQYKKAKSIDRIKYLYGRYETKASEFYDDFIRADESFNNREIEMMSDITHNMLRGINYRKIRKIRKSNFKCLNKKLKKYNKLKINKVGNYMYPFVVDSGAELRKELISKKIYIPKLWPNLDKFELNDFEKEIYKNMLPLPIDQRYNRKDMDYIATVINDTME